MSKSKKLLSRLLSKPKDFTWDEAVTLMKRYGFNLLKNGGSKRKFFNPETKALVMLHEPHPGNILKEYMVDEIITALRERGLLE